MNKETVLQKANSAVTAVEQKLTEIQKLTNDEKELVDSVEAAKQAESEILASDQKESAKLKKLLEIRATAEIRVADAKKLKAEIGAVTDEAIAAGARANLWLGALKDALIPARKSRLGSDLKPLFIPQAALEIDRLLNFSLEVRELEQLDQLHFSANRPEQSLASCKKIRAAFEMLAGAAEAEPELVEVISGDW